MPVIIDKWRIKSFHNYSSRKGKTDKWSASNVSATEMRTRNRTSMAGEGTIQSAQSRPYDRGGSGLNKTAQAAAIPPMGADPLAPTLIRPSYHYEQDKCENVHPVGILEKLVNVSQLAQEAAGLAQTKTEFSSGPSLRGITAVLFLVCSSDEYCIIQTNIAWRPSLL